MKGKSANNWKFLIGIVICHFFGVDDAMAASPVVARFEWVHSPSEFNIPAYFHWDIRNVKECYSTTSGSGAPALKATSGTIGPSTNSFPVSGKSKWYCIDLNGKRFPSDPTLFLEAARIVEAPLAAPTLTKPEGTYNAGVQISVVMQQGVMYRYTLNGDDVTTISPILISPLTLSSSATLRVRAYRPGFNPGAETKAIYTILPPAVVAPGMSPFGGTFVGSALVTLTPSTSGAQIRYTTNNTDVTASSPLYVSPFTLTANSTVKARSFKAGMTDSAPISAYFAIRAAAPAANPDGGSHIGPVSVVLKSNTELAQIRYSTNGSDVTASSTLYSVPFVLPSTATVKAKSFKSGMTDSTQTSVSFVIQPGSLQVIYLHSDALGSVIAETDANGNVIKRTEYMPFGQSKDN